MTTEPNLPLYQLREKLAFQYTTALESGDFETVAMVLQRATTDPELAEMLREIDAVYEQEAAQAMQAATMPVIGQRQSLSQPTFQTNGHHPPRNRAVQTGRRNWATLAAAVIVVIVTITGMMWSGNPAQFAALFGQQTASPTNTLMPTPTTTPTLLPSPTATGTPSPTRTPAPATPFSTPVIVPPGGIVVPLVPTLLSGIFDEVNRQLGKNLSEVNLTLEAVGTYVVLPTIDIPILSTPQLVQPSLPGQR